MSCIKIEGRRETKATVATLLTMSTFWMLDVDDRLGEYMDTSIITWLGIDVVIPTIVFAAMVLMASCLYIAYVIPIMEADRMTPGLHRRINSRRARLVFWIYEGALPFLLEKPI